jgi:hypothetical protein
MECYVSLSDDGKNVVTEYGQPQNDPFPANYVVLDDSDPRIVAFRAALAAQNK